MALVGLVLLLVYLVAAYLAFWLLASIWAARPNPAITLLAVAVAVVIVAYFGNRFGTRQLLANVGATLVPPDRAPALYERIGELCERMDVAVPTVYVARMAAPNALALGAIGRGSIVLDRSLFRILTTEEMDAILAHELAHLESHDGLVETLAYSLGQTVVGAVSVTLLPVSLFATGLARATAWFAGRPNAWSRNPFGRVRVAVDRVTVLALVLLTLLVRAHSRGREFAADDRAVDVTHRPMALANALEKLDWASDPDRTALSPLYVHSEEGPLVDWLSTHPSIDARIERLRQSDEREHVPETFE